MKYVVEYKEKNHSFLDICFYRVFFRDLLLLFYMLVFVVTMFFPLFLYFYLPSILHSATKFLHCSFFSKQWAPRTSLPICLTQWKIIFSSWISFPVFLHYFSIISTSISLFTTFLHFHSYSLYIWLLLFPFSLIFLLFL